jgi:predicted ArsR family transcriptional regulator
VRTAAQLVGASERAVRTGLGILVERGILSVAQRSASGPGRPSRLWIAPEVLKVFD